MAIENVKYIDASLEGSILKYDLDEPLIAGNVNVYQFRISLANIEEAQNSFWNFLLKNDGLFEVNFRSLKTSETGGEGTTVTLRKDSEENLQYLYCEVPDGSDGGNELYGGYRLEIEVRGSTTVDGKTYKYCTKTMPNPPMVYPSGAFKTSVDLSEETYLRSFMNKFTGGKPGQIMVKRSDSDYDIDWKKSLPNQLIFGGHGTFTETGDYEVVLTPAAQEILIERVQPELIDPQSMAEFTDDYPAFEEEISLKKITIDFSKPEYYTGLEFLCTSGGSYSFKEVQTEVNTGDKITSDGFGWGLVKASVIGIEGTSWAAGEVKTELYGNIPSYNITINNSVASINIPSLLPNGNLATLRNMSNYAGPVNKLVSSETDSASKWRPFGTCFFKVYSDSGTNGYITMATGLDEDNNLINIGEDGFVENLILGTDEIVFQCLTTNSGRRFYRSNAPAYENWPYWTQEFDYNQILPVTSGGTNANNAAGARENLEVYSQTEVNTKLSSKADLNTITEQQFKSALSASTLSVHPNASIPADSVVRFKDIGGIERARLWRGLSDSSNDYFYIQLSSRDATGTDNDKYYWYRLPAPATNPSVSTAFDIYHTGNIIYRTDQVPTFDKDIYPAGTICLVKVNE